MSSANIAYLIEAPNKVEMARIILKSGCRMDLNFRSRHILHHSRHWGCCSRQNLAKSEIFSIGIGGVSKAEACQKAFLEDKVNDEELGEQRMLIVKALLNQGYERQRIIGFLVFLKNFIFIDNEEINSRFDKQVVELTGGTIDMGIIETIKMQERREGRHEEALEIAREMKKDKFPIEQIAKLTKLTIEEIKAL